MNNPQIITHQGIPAFAVIPYQDYLSLIGSKPLTDEQAFAIAKTRNEEYFPEEVVHAIMAGENKIKVYREYRGLTQQELAAKIRKSKQYVSSLENNHKNGSIETLKMIAGTLMIDLDMI